MVWRILKTAYKKASFFLDVLLHISAFIIRHFCSNPEHIIIQRHIAIVLDYIVLLTAIQTKDGKDCELKNVLV